MKHSTSWHRNVVPPSTGRPIYHSLTVPRFFSGRVCRMNPLLNCANGCTSTTRNTSVKWSLTSDYVWGGPYWTCCVSMPWCLVLPFAFSFDALLCAQLGQNRSSVNWVMKDFLGEHVIVMFTSKLGDLTLLRGWISANLPWVSNRFSQHVYITNELAMSHTVTKPKSIPPKNGLGLSNRNGSHPRIKENSRDFQ